MHAGGLSLLFGDEPFRPVEGLDGAAAVGVELREKDVGDVGQPHVDPFAEPGGEGLGGEAGVDEDAGVARGDERGGGVAGADGGAFAPQGVGRQRADGDDADLHADEGYGAASFSGAARATWSRLRARADRRPRA